MPEVVHIALADRSSAGTTKDVIDERAFGTRALPISALSPAFEQKLSDRERGAIGSGEVCLDIDDASRDCGNDKPESRSRIITSLWRQDDWDAEKSPIHTFGASFTWKMRTSSTLPSGQRLASFGKL